MTVRLKDRFHSTSWWKIGFSCGEKFRPGKQWGKRARTFEGVGEGKEVYKTVYNVCSLRGKGFTSEDRLK